MPVDGFWIKGMRSTPARWNSMLWQAGPLSSRPNASQANKNMVWVDTDSGRVYQSSGTSWIIRISVNPAASIAGLRRLGNGAFDAAAGNHGH